MLSMTNVSKTYPNGVRALRGVQLEIGPGMFGLLGPNGAGKSTLMRIIAALQTPDEGRLLLDGVDILAHPQAVRDQLGYLPQEFGVYPKVSALALLDHLAVLKGILDKHERREQVAALLEQTNLYSARKKAVHSFSGGMRQRFGIAQALPGNPRIMIVDEPTAGLDPEERHRFHNLLGEIGEHRLVILSTHMVEDVRHLCPKMAVLVDGQVQLVGEPEALIMRMRGMVWRKTVRKEDLPQLREHFTILSTRLIAGRPQVHILAEDAPDGTFTQIDPNLEDVYFSVLRPLREARPC